MFKDDPDLLKNIVTSDESWLYGYDIKTKAQSFLWKRPEEARLKKARQARSRSDYRRIWRMMSNFRQQISAFINEDIAV